MRVNGHNAGVLWTPPFKVDIARWVHAGENILEVRVANQGVSNGTLRVAANTTLASTNWIVSSGATFTFDSAVTLSGKDVVIDAGGAVTPGLLDVTGNLTLGGKLTVANAGDRQKIAQCTGMLSGDFSETALPKGQYLRQVSGKELWVIRAMGTCIRVL